MLAQRAAPSSSCLPQQVNLHAVLRLLAPLLLPVALSGCSLPELCNILVNGSAQAIKVTFRPHPTIHTLGVCPLMPGQGLIAPVSDAWTQKTLSQHPLHWSASAGQQIDTEKCIASATLLPQHGFLISADSWCDDYQEVATDRGLELNTLTPQIDELTVATREGVVTYRGWDAVTWFVRQRSGHCLYVVR